MSGSECSRGEHSRDREENGLNEVENEVVKLRNELHGFRMLLFLRHGCSLSDLYGDDGELQCKACNIDFKRFTVREIEMQFTQIGLERVARSAQGTVR